MHSTHCVFSIASVCLGELFRMRYYLGAVFICVYLVELLGARKLLLLHTQHSFVHRKGHVVI